MVLKIKNNLFLKNKKWTIIFLLPAILFIFFTYIYPMIYSFILSFHSYSMLIPKSTPVFIGLKNYINVIKSIDFFNSLKITFIFSFFAIFFEFILGLILALLITIKLKITSLLRVSLLIPLMVTPVVAGILWRLMYNPAYGIINYFISLFGIQPQTWLGSIAQALPAVINVEIWQQLPVFTFILAAGIMAIPNEVYEAGMVDGCNRFGMFWNITFPLLKPAIIVALLLRIIDTVRIFDVVYTMTQGGPGASTKFISLLIYEKGLKFFDIGASSAQSWILVMIVLLIEFQFLRIILRKGLY